MDDVGSGSLVDEREEALGRCNWTFCFFLFLATDEDEGGVLDFLFLVLLGLTGKNMAGS